MLHVCRTCILYLMVEELQYNMSHEGLIQWYTMTLTQGYNVVDVCLVVCLVHHNQLMPQPLRAPDHLRTVVPLVVFRF